MNTIQLENSNINITIKRNSVIMSKTIIRANNNFIDCVNVTCVSAEFTCIINLGTIFMLL